MHWILSGWGLFTLAMVVTVVVSVVAEGIETIIYNMRESGYRKYNGQFSEVFKAPESPFASKKKKVKPHTTLLMVSWALTGAAAVAIAVKLNWITNLYLPILLFVLALPVLAIVIAVIYIIVSAVLMLFIESKSGAKRTILKIRKRYKIED